MSIEVDRPNPVVRYRGQIDRQELVDYCVSLANKQRQELLREQDILDKNEKTMSDDQYETLVISQATLMGSINALRAVTEWARQRVEAAGQASRVSGQAVSYGAIGGTNR